MKKSKYFILTLVILAATSVNNVNAENLNNNSTAIASIKVDADVEREVSVTKYYNTVTAYDKNKQPLYTKDYEVSKAEYESDNWQENIALPQSFGEENTYETNGKKITLRVMPGGGASAKLLSIDVEWKMVPSVKLYDLIGFYAQMDGNISFMPNSSMAYQRYDGITYTYYNDSGNKIKKTNGMAFIMNIIDDTRESLSIHMETAFISQGNVEIWATYQHAVSTSITENEARSLTFGRTAKSGYQVLGGAFVYRDSVANKYDKMGGVHVFYDAGKFE